MFKRGFTENNIEIYFLFFKDVTKLKSEIESFKSTNSNLNFKANNLEQQIENLHLNISKSLKVLKICRKILKFKVLNFKKQKSGKIENSFEKIDNRFFELNKILSDINESKLLLQKTSYIPPIPHSTRYMPCIGYNLNNEFINEFRYKSFNYDPLPHNQPICPPHLHYQQTSFMNNPLNSNSRINDDYFKLNTDFTDMLKHPLRKNLSKSDFNLVFIFLK